MPDRLMERLAAADPVRRAPAALDAGELIAGWVECGDVRESEPPGTTGPLRRVHGRVATWLAGGLVLAAVGTASAAAAFTALTGSPLPPGSDSFTVSPQPGTTRISEVRAEDPDGGPPWAVRLGTAEAGLLCIGVGQIQGNQLGLVGLDRVFRAVPPAGSDDCGAPPAGERSTVATRTFLGKPRSHSVTVVFGVRAPSGSSVRVRYADGPTQVLPVGRDGTFLVARRGNLAPQSPRIEIRLPRGRLSIVRLSPSSTWPARPPARALDPSEPPRQLDPPEFSR